MNDPLQLPLKDIHLPQALSWWPPAPGWWILLALIFCVAASAYWLYQRRQRIKRSAVNMARVELDSLQSQYASHQDARQFIADLSILLRRLSISAFPRTETASLTGEAWLQFLDSPLQNTPFTSGAGRILIEAPYRPDVKEAELQPLIEVCHLWIEQLATKKAGQSR
jgi:Domain of unknown function (DUF4381)